MTLSTHHTAVTSGKAKECLCLYATCQFKEWMNDHVLDLSLQASEGVSYRAFRDFVRDYGTVYS